MVTATFPIRVRYAETDQMGFAYHGTYFPWLEQARIHLLDTIGFPYRQLEAEDFFLPVLEAHLTYRKPAYFDDHLSIEARIEERPSVRIRIEYEVRRGELLLAEGHTVHAFINKAGRPVRPPAALIEAIAGSAF